MGDLHTVFAVFFSRQGQKEIEKQAVPIWGSDVILNIVDESGFYGISCKL
jgi:hypothetical protein